MIDPLSQTWREIERHAELRIAQHHAGLEGPLTAEQTERVRGAIAEMRALLALKPGQSDPGGTGRPR